MPQSRTFAWCVYGLFFAVLALLYCWPLLEHPHYWGIQDWDQHLFYQAVPRLTVLDHHQIPLWNPYHSGGLPGLANPQSRFLFPSFAFVLVWGVVWGIKLEIWFHYWLGLVGVFALGRQVGLDRGAAVVAAAIYMLGGMLALSIAGGMTTFLCAALIPWILLCHRKTRDQPRFALLTGLGLALMFFDGGAHLVMLAVLLLTLHAGLDGIVHGAPWRRQARILAATFAAAALVGGVKLVPALELMQRFPRTADAYSGYSVHSLLLSLMQPGQRVTTAMLPQARGWLTGMSWGMDENGLYVGVLACCLFAVGLALRWRRHRVLAVLFGLTLWLSFGERAPLSLWAVPKQLPVFESMRVAQRFRFFFMLCFALFAGAGFQQLRHGLTGRVRSRVARVAVLGGCLLGLLATLVQHNGASLAEAFTIPPPEIAPAGQFRQIQRRPSYGRSGWLASQSWDDRDAWSALYPAVLENVGTVDAYEPIADGFVTPVVGADSEAYRGEVTLIGSPGTAVITHWSPNRLVVAVQAETDGRILVNQNFAPGWRVDGMEAIDHGGLIAADVTPQTKRLELAYRPRGFRLGLVLSLVGIGWIAAAFAFSRRPRKATLK